MKFLDAFERTLSITERPGDFFTVIFATAAVWVCLTAQYSLVFIAMHHPLPYDATFFISGVTTIGVALPTTGGVGRFHKVCHAAVTSVYGFDIDSSVAIVLMVDLGATVPVA